MSMRSSSGLPAARQITEAGTASRVIGRSVTKCMHAVACGTRGLHLLHAVSWDGCAGFTTPIGANSRSAGNTLRWTAAGTGTTDDHSTAAPQIKPQPTLHSAESWATARTCVQRSTGSACSSERRCTFGCDTCINGQQWPGTLNKARAWTHVCCTAPA